MKKAALFILLVFVGSASALEIEGITPNKTVTYKRTGDVELKLHVFNPPGHKASDKRPAIVFFFGGGWVGGSPTQFFPHCRYLSSRGMVAVSAEYRVKNKHKTTPKECVEDGKSAVRWLRQHAAELGIDPNRLAAGGGSAGGHVAAAAGTLKGFDRQDEDKKVSSKPNALVLFNPVFDNGPEGWGHAKVKDYWEKISPMHNIDKNTPPTIVFLGTKDKLIPVATAKEYKALMEKAKVRCNLHLYKDRGHGFFNYRGDLKDYYLTVTEADKFLASLGYLKGPPTLPYSAHGIDELYEFIVRRHRLPLTGDYIGNARANSKSEAVKIDNRDFLVLYFNYKGRKSLAWRKNVPIYVISRQAREHTIIGEFLGETLEMAGQGKTVTAKVTYHLGSADHSHTTHELRNGKFGNFAPHARGDVFK